MEPKKMPFGTKCGYLIGTVAVSCITLLVVALMLALAAKAIIGLLLWIF